MQQLQRPQCPLPYCIHNNAMVCGASSVGPRRRHGASLIQRNRATVVRASESKKGLSAASSGSPDTVSALAKSMLRDVVAGVTSLTSTSSSSTVALAPAAPMHEDLRSPSYAIAALNALLFAVCALVPLLPAAGLLLNHRSPAAWQLLTSCFAHSSLDSVLQSIFFIYIFGRVVERNHGSVATWAVYLTCGMAAALAWFMLPAKVGLLSSAAPAAAWGLFLVGVGLPRLTRKPLEVACMAPFAFAATTARYAPLSGALVHEGTAVGHLVHLAGASLAAGLAAGVLSVVERVREDMERKRLEARRQAEAARQNEAVSRIVDMAGQAAQQLGRKLG